MNSLSCNEKRAWFVVHASTQSSAVSSLRNQYYLPWVRIQHTTHVFEIIILSSFLVFLKIFYLRWWWVPPPEMSQTQKTPEINELEYRENILKI